MIHLVYPFCEKCGRDGMCRYKDDLHVMIKKMDELTSKMEASHFQFSVKCPDFYRRAIKENEND